MVKKQIPILLISMVILFGLSSISEVSAHAPSHIDLKYYVEEEVLSIYVIHGVSDEETHWVQSITLDFYDLPQSFLDEYNSTVYMGDPREHYADGTLKSDRIQEHDVWDLEEAPTPSETLNSTTYTFETQEHHQINHYNISIYIPEWTYIVVTAGCNLEGTRTYYLISGHQWYDIEHSMIEAVVPTLVCSVIVMTPLALWRIFGRKPKEEQPHHQNQPSQSEEVKQ